MATQSRSPIGFNLTALLAVLSLLDLVFHRTFARFSLPDTDLSPQTNLWLMGAGTFLGYLCSLLGIAIIAVTLSSPANRRELFPRAIQTSLFFIALIYCALVLRAVWITDERFGLHLQISYGFLVTFAVSGLWYVQPKRPLLLATRLGATLVMLPLLTHTFLAFAHQAQLVKGPAVFFWTGRAAEILGFLALCLAPVWLRDDRASTLALWQRVFTIAVSSVALAGVLTLVLFRFDLASALFLQGVRLQLPSIESLFGKGYLLLMALAVAGAAATVVMLGWRKGAPRLVAYGFLLTLFAGFPGSYAGASATSLAGLLCIAVGLKRRGSIDASGPPTHENERQSEPERHDEVQDAKNKLEAIA
ncbi:MAG: hypothetical protein SGI86_05940 [Deltaproteobacteria bacterium]|nr:hypothetical protein [Deltaproteobacteria bacterium]